MIREAFRTLVAVATFAALMAALTTTARGAGDPPRIETPDPPRIEKLEKRTTELERRLDALESIVRGPTIVPASAPAPAVRSYPLGQRFTADNGVTYALDSEGHYRAVSDLVPAAVGSSWSQTAGRAPVGHTHTCSRGHTWDHSTNPGHNCPVCGESQFVQDTRPRAVNVGVQSFTQPQPSQFRTYTIGGTSSGCANGQCETVDFRGGKKFGR